MILEFNELVFVELCDDGELHVGSEADRQAKRLLGSRTSFVGEDDQELFEMVSRRYALHNPPLVS